MTRFIYKNQEGVVIPVLPLATIMNDNFIICQVLKEKGGILYVYRQNLKIENTPQSNENTIQNKTLV